MYIFKNALKSISRSKGRNILIGVIVMIIAVASTVSLSIKKAAKTAEETGLENLKITASIGVDRQKLIQNSEGLTQDEMREVMQSYSNLSLEEMQAYAKSEYVKTFIYSASASINGNDSLSPYNESDTEEDNESSSFPGGMGGPAISIFGGFSGQVGDFTLTGYSSEDAMTDFVSGTSKITEGSMFDVASADLKCIISNELAVYNGISVGDAIIITNPNNEDETYTFTVTGIYTNISSSTSGGGMMFSTAQDQANQIYTSYGALSAIVALSAGNDEDNAIIMQVNGTYTFSSADNYEKFSNAVYDMGLDEHYSVSSTDVIAFEQSLLPLQNISKFANTMFLMVLAIGGLILVLFNIYSIRERKYEVGVLTAIGMKKSKVAMQFVSEIFMVTIFALIIGIGIGASVSVPTADKLLASQITSQQTQSSQRDMNFGRQPSGNLNTPSVQKGSSDSVSNGAGGILRNRFTNYITEINAATDISVVLNLLGIGILLTIAASSAAIIFVLRYEPLKILSERS